LLKGAESKVRVKNLCGCRVDMLLQCELVFWIKEVQEELVPALLDNEPEIYNKFLKDKEHICANSIQIYEWRHIYQFRLRQILNNHALISYFSLAREPNLEPVLYQRL